MRRESAERGIETLHFIADLKGVSHAAALANSQTRQVYYDTSVGTIEVLFDEPSGILSVYRFDHKGRPIAAAFENCEFRHLAEVLSTEAGVPPAEAEEMAATLAEKWGVDVLRPVGDATSAGATRRPTRFLFVLLCLAALALLAIVARGLWGTMQALF
jgi:hypothetical protein